MGKSFGAAAAIAGDVIAQATAKARHDLNTVEFCIYGLSGDFAAEARRMKNRCHARLYALTGWHFRLSATGLENHPGTASAVSSREKS